MTWSRNRYGVAHWAGGAFPEPPDAELEETDQPDVEPAPDPDVATRRARNREADRRAWERARREFGRTS